VNNHSAKREIVLLEDALWLLVELTGLPIYDFDFRKWFHCRGSYERPTEMSAVARVGAVTDYGRFYLECKSDGVIPIHSPDEYLRASQLDKWYPLISDLTPRSVCFKGKPGLAEVKAQFNWPIFMKGARQTSHHQRRLSIIQSEADFCEAIESFSRDPILAWQDTVCRELISLRRLNDSDKDSTRLPRSFEFRTFWWKGKLAGAGRYWWEGAPYDWTTSERAAALAIGEEVARRLDVPFLVVDLAQTADGRWIAIECNDAQESGYAGVSPIGLWQKVVDYERASA
jgi:hypothetical protein